MRGILSAGNWKTLKICTGAGCATGACCAFKAALAEHQELERAFRDFKIRGMRRIIVTWYDDLREARGLERLGPEPEDTDELLSSDIETNPDDAGRLAEAAARTGADIVCASRWLRGGGFSGYDPLKLVLNYGYNLIFRALYGIRIHDITFGYRLMTAEVLRKVRWEYGRHEFCAEILLKPVRLGYTAVEVPTRWIKRAEGESKNTFMRNFKFASAAWKIRFARRAELWAEAP